MRAAILTVAALAPAAAPSAFAQLVSHADAPVRIGHYHLNVTSVEAHKKFWADTLGGRAIKFGGIDVIEFPDAFIFLRVQKPTGPTRGTAFDHIGFAVAGAWFALLLSGRRRPEPTWLDRLGRAIGWLWLGLSVVLWVRSLLL